MIQGRRYILFLKNKGNKINRARTKRKQSMDDIAMALHILNFAHSFGKGILPHNSGSLPRECLETYMEYEGTPITL